MLPVRAAQLAGACGYCNLFPLSEALAVHAKQVLSKWEQDAVDKSNQGYPTKQSKDRFRVHVFSL
jgi:hypothetical protein